MVYGRYQEIKMKPRNLRVKSLWTAVAFVPAMLVAPALFADEHEHKAPSTSGHQSTPSHSAPSTSHSAPSGGSHTPPSTPHTQSAPQSHTPSNGSGGYNPGNSHQGGASNPGANTNNRPGGYNPGNRTPSTPSTNTAPGNRTPGYNPGNNTNNRPGGGYNPGNNTNNRPGGGYNPGTNTNNRPGGGYNPGTNTNNRPGGYNPGNNSNNRPGGTYNPGGNRPGGMNTGGNRPGPSTFHAPAGAVSHARPGGGMTYAHNGATYNTDSRGHLASYSRPGAEARFGNNGRISSAHFTRPDHSNVYVNRGPRGERTVVTVRPGGTRIVSYGPRAGFYERAVIGRPGYVSRTYIYGGRPYARVYRVYGWRGVTYYRYVPPVYYAPAFYGWAWAPWRAPIVFSWGWRRDPWFGFYGGYFAPAPVYPTASLWLTDYLLAENLRLAYESQQAAMQQPGGYPPPQQDAYPPPQNGAVTLTPEVKAAIAEEVRQQLEAERAAAAGGQPQGGYNQPTNGYPPPQQPGQPGQPGYTPTGGDVPPPALDPKQRIFVVSTNLDVTATGGQGCALTPGDIILRTGDQPVNGNRIGVSVLSSKPGDCPVNSATDIEVAALQEMHNQFREQVDTGMRQLAENQGKNGLPPAPPANPRQVPDGQAPPEQASTVEQALAQQQADANQAEQEVQQAANSAQ
jgi:hypothetical protein